MKVVIVCQPSGWIERIGVRLGFVRRSIEADLARFLRFVERDPNDVGRRTS